MDLYAEIDRIAGEHPRRLCVEAPVSDDNVLGGTEDGVGSVRKSATYEELSDMSKGIADTLTKKCGITPGDAVELHAARSVEWYAVIIALNRVGACILCTDPDDVASDTGRRRMEYVRRSVRPRFRIEKNPKSQTLASVRNATDASRSSVELLEYWYCEENDNDHGKYDPSTWCFCTTGGTTSDPTKPKIAKCTRNMASSELSGYRALFGQWGFDSFEESDADESDPPAPRVLQPNAINWGAAVFGQIDLAIAVEGTLVICDLRKIERGLLQNLNITIAGLTPTLWKQVEIPECLDIAISWGDRCMEDLEFPRRIGKPPCLFFDLLLATEYWLAFYRASCRERFEFVPEAGVLAFAALEEGGITVDGSDKVELVVSGSCVFSGYVDSEPESDHKDDNLPYFTGDRINVVHPPDSTVVSIDERKLVQLSKYDRFYMLGRLSVDIVKVHGNWASVGFARHVAESVCEEVFLHGNRLICCVKQKNMLTLRAKTQGTNVDVVLFVVPDAYEERYWEAVAEAHLGSGGGSGTSWLLPRDTLLPRNPATSKVNLRELDQMVANGPFAILNRWRAGIRCCEITHTVMLVWLGDLDGSFAVLRNRSEEEVVKEKAVEPLQSEIPTTLLYFVDGQALHDPLDYQHFLSCVAKGTGFPHTLLNGETMSFSDLGGNSLQAMQVISSYKNRSSREDDAAGITRNARRTSALAPSDLIRAAGTPLARFYLQHQPPKVMDTPDLSAIVAPESSKASFLSAYKSRVQHFVDSGLRTLYHFSMRTAARLKSNLIPSDRLLIPTKLQQSLVRVGETNNGVALQFAVELRKASSSDDILRNIIDIMQRLEQRFEIFRTHYWWIRRHGVKQSLRWRVMPGGIQNLPITGRKNTNLLAYFRDDAKQQFDEMLPLWRCCLLGDRNLAFTVSHSVMDQWGMMVFLGELDKEMKRVGMRPQQRCTGMKDSYSSDIIGDSSAGSDNRSRSFGEDANIIESDNHAFSDFCVTHYARFGKDVRRKSRFWSKHLGKGDYTKALPRWSFMDNEAQFPEQGDRTKHVLTVYREQREQVSRENSKSSETNHSKSCDLDLSAEVYPSLISILPWDTFDRGYFTAAASGLALTSVASLFHALCQIAVGPMRSLCHLFAGQPIISNTLTAAPLFFPFDYERTEFSRFAKEVDSTLFSAMQHANCSFEDIRSWAKIPSKKKLFTGIVLCHNYADYEFETLELAASTEYPTYDLVFEFDGDKFRVKAENEDIGWELQFRVATLLQRIAAEDLLGVKKAILDTNASSGRDASLTASVSGVNGVSSTIADLLNNSYPFGAVFSPHEDISPLALPQRDSPHHAASAGEDQSQREWSSRICVSGRREHRSSFPDHPLEMDMRPVMALCNAFYQAVSLCAGDLVPQNAAVGVVGSMTTVNRCSELTGLSCPWRPMAVDHSVVGADLSNKSKSMFEGLADLRGRRGSAYGAWRLLTLKAETPERLGIFIIESVWALQEMLWSMAEALECRGSNHGFFERGYLLDMLFDRDSPTFSKTDFLRRALDYEVDESELWEAVRRDVIILFLDSGKLYFSETCYFPHQIDEVVSLCDELCKKQLDLGNRQVEADDSSKAIVRKNSNPSKHIEVVKAAPIRIINPGDNESELLPQGEGFFCWFSQQVERTPENVALVFACSVEAQDASTDAEELASVQEMWRAIGSVSYHELWWLIEDEQCFDRSKPKKRVPSGILSPLQEKIRRKIMGNGTRMRSTTRIRVASTSKEDPGATRSKDAQFHRLSPLKQRVQKNSTNLPCIGTGDRNLDVILLLKSLRYYGTYIPRSGASLSPGVNENPEVSGYPWKERGIILHTSGSTGKPKPVLVSERNISTHLLYLQKHHPLTPEDASLCCVDFQWVAHFPEILQPLMVGASVIVGSFRELHKFFPCKNGVGLAAQREEDSFAFTTCQLIPSVLTAFSDIDVFGKKGLRRIVFTGEAFPVKYAEMLQNSDSVSSELRVLNHFGQTEVSDTTTCFDVTGSMATDSESRGKTKIPIGSPIRHRRCMMQQPESRTAPQELVAAGAALGHYLDVGKAALVETMFISKSQVELRQCIRMAKLYCEKTPESAKGGGESRRQLCHLHALWKSWPHAEGADLAEARRRKWLQTMSHCSDESVDWCDSHNFQRVCKENGKEVIVGGESWTAADTVKLSPRFLAFIANDPNLHEQFLREASSELNPVAFHEVSGKVARSRCHLRFRSRWRKTTSSRRSRGRKTREVQQFPQLRKMFSKEAGNARGLLTSGQKDNDRKAAHFEADMCGPGRQFLSGDLVKSNGVADCLQVVGRKDKQVKINGQRADLSSIELVCSSVASSCVVRLMRLWILQSVDVIEFRLLDLDANIDGCDWRKSGSTQKINAGATDRDVEVAVGSEQILVAFVQGSEVGLESLKSVCQKHLQRHLVPAFFVDVKQWPRLRSGKIDKKVSARAVLDEDLFVSGSISANVSGIIADVLGEPSSLQATLAKHKVSFELIPAAEAITVRVERMPCAAPGVSISKPRDASKNVQDGHPTPTRAKRVLPKSSTKQVASMPPPRKRLADEYPSHADSSNFKGEIVRESGTSKLVFGGRDSAEEENHIEPQMLTDALENWVLSILLLAIFGPLKLLMYPYFFRFFCGLKQKIMCTEWGHLLFVEKIPGIIETQFGAVAWKQEQVRDYVWKWLFLPVVALVSPLPVHVVVWQISFVVDVVVPLWYHPVSEIGLARRFSGVPYSWGSSDSSLEATVSSLTSICRSEVRQHSSDSLNDSESKLPLLIGILMTAYEFAMTSVIPILLYAIQRPIGVILLFYSGVSYVKKEDSTSGAYYIWNEGWILTLVDIIGKKLDELANSSWKDVCGVKHKEVKTSTGKEGEDEKQFDDVDQITDLRSDSSPVESFGCNVISLGKKFEKVKEKFREDVLPTLLEGLYPDVLIERSINGWNPHQQVQYFGGTSGLEASRRAALQLATKQCKSNTDSSNTDSTATSAPESDAISKSSEAVAASNNQPSHSTYDERVLTETRGKTFDMRHSAIEIDKQFGFLDAKASEDGADCDKRPFSEREQKVLDVVATTLLPSQGASVTRGTRLFGDSLKVMQAKNKLSSAGHPVGQVALLHCETVEQLLRCVLGDVTAEELEVGEKAEDAGANPSNAMSGEKELEEKVNEPDSESDEADARVQDASSGDSSSNSSKYKYGNSSANSTSPSTSYCDPHEHQILYRLGEPYYFHAMPVKFTLINRNRDWDAEIVHLSLLQLANRHVALRSLFHDPWEFHQLIHEAGAHGAHTFGSTGFLHRWIRKLMFIGWARCEALPRVEDGRFTMGGSGDSAHGDPESAPELDGGNERTTPIQKRTDAKSTATPDRHFKYLTSYEEGVVLYSSLLSCCRVVDYRGKDLIGEHASKHHAEGSGTDANASAAKMNAAAFVSSDNGSNKDVNSTTESERNQLLQPSEASAVTPSAATDSPTTESSPEDDCGVSNLSSEALASVAGHSGSSSRTPRRPRRGSNASTVSTAFSIVDLDRGFDDPDEHRNQQAERAADHGAVPEVGGGSERTMNNNARWVPAGADDEGNDLLLDGDTRFFANFLPKAIAVLYNDARVPDLAKVLPEGPAKEEVLERRVARMEALRAQSESSVDGTSSCVEGSRENEFLNSKRPPVKRVLKLTFTHGVVDGGSANPLLRDFLHFYDVNMAAFRRGGEGEAAAGSSILTSFQGLARLGEELVNEVEDSRGSSSDSGVKRKLTDIVYRDNTGVCVVPGSFHHKWRRLDRKLGAKKIDRMTTMCEWRTQHKTEENDVQDTHNKTNDGEKTSAEADEETDDNKDQESDAARLEKVSIRILRTILFTLRTAYEGKSSRRPFEDTVDHVLGKADRWQAIGVNVKNNSTAKTKKNGRLCDFFSYLGSRFRYARPGLWILGNLVVWFYCALLIHRIILVRLATFYPNGFVSEDSFVNMSGDAELSFISGVFCASLSALLLWIFVRWPFFPTNCEYNPEFSWLLSRKRAWARGSMRGQAGVRRLLGKVDCKRNGVGLDEQIESSAYETQTTESGSQVATNKYFGHCLAKLPQKANLFNRIQLPSSWFSVLPILQTNSLLEQSQRLFDPLVNLSTRGGHDLGRYWECTRHVDDYEHLFQFDCGRWMQFLAAKYHVGIDVALVVVMAITGHRLLAGSPTIAETERKQFFEPRKVLRLTIVVPMRDNADETSLVANLVTHRIIRLRFHEATRMSDAFRMIATKIKNRDWETSRSCERTILINLRSSTKKWQSSLVEQRSAMLDPVSSESASGSTLVIADSKSSENLKSVTNTDPRAILDLPTSGSNHQPVAKSDDGIVQQNQDFGNNSSNPLVLEAVDKTSPVEQTLPSATEVLESVCRHNIRGAKFPHDGGIRMMIDQLTDEPDPAKNRFVVWNRMIEKLFPTGCAPEHFDDLLEDTIEKLVLGMSETTSDTANISSRGENGGANSLSSNATPMESPPNMLNQSGYVVGIPDNIEREWRKTRESEMVRGDSDLLYGPISSSIQRRRGSATIEKIRAMGLVG